MKTVLLAATLYLVASCAAPKPELGLSSSSKVLVYDDMGEPGINPDNRNLQKAGSFDSAGVADLQLFLKGARTKRLGYVMSRRYLRVEDRTIGVVMASNKDFIGLDVSTTDASRMHVTSTHVVLVNEDKNLAARLLQHVNKAAE